IQTNQCLDGNGGCWEDKATNVTACRDTFRGRVCECPTVQGTKFVGDGYTHCEASGPLHCTINNGGCWKEIRDNQTYSACIEGSTSGCKCPSGFKGDGLNCEGKDGIAGSGWRTFWLTVLGIAAFGTGGYLRYMDSEIRAIMAQYMPLDDNHGGYMPVSGGHGEAPGQAHHGDI
ncbi:hypothetical protein CRG98_041589, partial [Punica granatum]